MWYFKGLVCLINTFSYFEADYVAVFFCQSTMWKEQNQTLFGVVSHAIHLFN